MRKFLTCSALALCLSLVLCGCNLRSMFGGQEVTNAETPISTAIVISEEATLYDEPGGNAVGTLAKGVTVTFRDSQTCYDQLWVECITPVEYTWMLLSDLQITSGGTMSFVYSPDGSLNGGMVQMVVGPNGELTVVNPDGTKVDEEFYPITDNVDNFLLEGAYFHVPYDENGYHGSITTWYFGHNGYALMETGDGEVDGTTIYLNYTNQRLFGTYSIIGGVLTFTVTEDWYYPHGENIGTVYTYQYSENSDGFTLDDDQFTYMGNGYYLEDVTGHTGGPTGNDLTDPNYQEPVMSKLPSEVLGTWVSFERTASGQQTRRMWTFTDNQTNMHPCIYQEHIFDNIGGGWEILPISPYTEYYYDSCCMLNGQMYVDYGPDQFGPYDLNLQGDTLTITYTDWNGVTQSHTYTRTTSSNPKPN